MKNQEQVKLAMESQKAQATLFYMVGADKRAVDAALAYSVLQWVLGGTDEPLDLDNEIQKAIDANEKLAQEAEAKAIDKISGIFSAFEKDGSDDSSQNETSESVSE